MLKEQSAPSVPKASRIVALLQLALALGFIGFWILFFAEDACRVSGPRLADCLATGKSTDCARPALACERYLAFENSFPLPDLGFIVPLLLLSAWGIWQNRRMGLLTGIMAGSALIFLGLLDISFNLQNARYSTGMIDLLMNGVINLVCVIFGPLLVRFCWVRL